jgi:hypothetical protein
MAGVIEEPSSGRHASDGSQIHARVRVFLFDSLSPGLKDVNGIKGPATLLICRRESSLPGAWKDATHGQDLRLIDGLTPAHRLFVGFAQWACGDERDENKRVNAITNPHSPPEYRINGVVVNTP